jgi:type IV secretion system protein TrbI
MAETTVPSSPDSLQLRGRPFASARLSRKAAFVAIAVLTVILVIIFVNVSKERAISSANAATKTLEPAMNAARALTNNLPELPPSSPPLLPDLPPAPASSAPVRDRAQRYDEEARLADTAIPTFSNPQYTPVQHTVAAASVEGPTQSEIAGGNNINTNTYPNGPPSRTAGGLLHTADRTIADESDPNRQAEKLTFSRAVRESAYLDSRLQAPLSPYELKTGTVIPSILIGSANSDLPGDLVAQVSQNVYDTVSGNHLLIPQGTRLFGHYDSQLTFGQARLLVSWQRLIYPNGSTLELKGMNGYDQEGAAGFADRVNNHYGRIFGWALLTSVFSAGSQLSQPQQANSLVPSNGQVAAASVGQQMTQLGAELAARNIQVQPTVEIRKGYRFNVMVNKDIVFPGNYEP